MKTYDPEPFGGPFVEPNSTRGGAVFPRPVKPTSQPRLSCGHECDCSHPLVHALAEAEFHSTTHGTRTAYQTLRDAVLTYLGEIGEDAP